MRPDERPAEPPLLLTVAEVSALTRISRSMLYELLAAGQLRSVKVGRRRLIPRAAVDEMLTALEAAAQ